MYQFLLPCLFLLVFVDHTIEASMLIRCLGVVVMVETFLQRHEGFFVS